MKSSFLQKFTWKEENIGPNQGFDNVMHIIQDIQMFLPHVVEAELSAETTISMSFGGENVAGSVLLRASNSKTRGNPVPPVRSRKLGQSGEDPLHVPCSTG